MKIVHGTPAGYATGCRNASCPNQGSDELMTCADAIVRYRGDYSYRKAIDAGEQVNTRETFVVKLKPAPRPTKTAAPKQKRVESEGTTAPHGTTARYRRGCTTDDQCPNNGTEFETCRQCKNREGRESSARTRRAAGIAPRGESAIPHGTKRGYNRGCRLRDQCPSKLAGGASCTEAHVLTTKQLRAVKRKANPPKIKPRASHPSRALYRSGCRIPAQCPSKVAGGLSCNEVEAAYQRDRLAARKSA